MPSKYNVRWNLKECGYQCSNFQTGDLKQVIEYSFEDQQRDV